MASKRASPPETAEPGAPSRAAVEPHVRIGFLVHDVSRMRRTLFDQAVKPLGITRAQWWALANLSRQGPDGMVQTKLARILDVGKVTVGGLIDRLEASGHVERRLDPVDRRIKRIVITHRGYELIEQMKSVGRELNTTVLSGISTDHVSVAETVLHQMKVNLRRRLRSRARDALEPDDD